MRKLWTVLRRLGVAVLVVLAAVVVYGRVGLVLDTAPSESEMVTVRGHRMHLRCAGSGSPTFLLDAGLGGWSVHWYRVQPLLAKYGYVCAFDRPGLGWSDDIRAPHDAAAAADELSALVAAARIQTPFVYVGHSLGANFAEVYAAKHPRDVAALVLLDPGDPKDLLEDFHGSRADAMSAAECGITCALASAAGELGFTRIMSLTAGRHSFSGNERAEYRAAIARPGTLRAMSAEYGALPKTAYQVLDVKSFGTIPVLVLSSTAFRPPEGKETATDVIVWRRGYLTYLSSLAAKSSRGEGPAPIVDSDHVSMVLGERQAARAAELIGAFSRRIGPAGR